MNTHILMKRYSIIVAGGSGQRMNNNLPKQFLLLKGKPILMHTIDAFYQTLSDISIIVVLHPNYHEYWNELCQKHHFSTPHQLIDGGNTRFESVKNGLSLVKEKKSLVAIHDAVRPLISHNLIETSYQEALKHGNAIAATLCKDSVRMQLNNQQNKILDRNKIYLIQTPQTFNYQTLQQAYQLPYSEKFTDDASVVEQAGFSIFLIEGENRNIKITFPEDLIFAEAILNSIKPDIFST